MRIFVSMSNLSLEQFEIFCDCPVLSFSLAHVLVTLIATGTQGGTVVLTFISGPFLSGQI